MLVLVDDLLPQHLDHPSFSHTSQTTHSDERGGRFKPHINQETQQCPCQSEHRQPKTQRTRSLLAVSSELSPLELRTDGQALLRLLRRLLDTRLGLGAESAQQRSQSPPECARVLSDTRPGADSAGAGYTSTRVRSTRHRKAKRSAPTSRLFLHDVWFRSTQWHFRSRLVFARIAHLCVSSVSC